MPAQALKVGELYSASGRYFRLIRDGAEIVGETIKNPWNIKAPDSAAAQPRGHGDRL